MKPATMGSTALHRRVLGLSIALALTAAPAFAQEVDHAAMGHAPPTEEVDHAAIGHHKTAPNTQVDHAAMGHAVDTRLPADAPPINPIPPITQADREAAFPDVAGHHVHDNAVHSFWLLDRLEAWDADTGTGAGWEATAWVGTDIDRLWLRSEGEHADGTTGSADIEVLYGRPGGAVGMLAFAA